MEINILIRVFNYEMEEHYEAIGAFDNDHIVEAEEYARGKYPKSDFFYLTTELNSKEYIG